MLRLIYAFCVALLAAPTSAQDIGGSYSVEGTNFDGSPYRGTAEITLTSTVTCEIVWTTGNTSSSGICMRLDNAFTAAYQLGDAIGLIIYLVQPDGTLEGTWTLRGSNGVGSEVLRPR